MIPCDRTVSIVAGSKETVVQQECQTDIGRPVQADGGILSEMGKNPTEITANCIDSGIFQTNLEPCVDTIYRKPHRA